jgi:hypothetical protein
MKTTTLNKIRKYSPCEDGWKKLLTFLGKTSADDEPLPFSTILESNGLDDALWCCKTAPEFDREWRTFAVWCARQVQHLMGDERFIECLNVIDAFIAGTATVEEMASARPAAMDAAWAAAMDAAWAAAMDAARDAARDAAWVAAVAASVAAARDAAMDDARDAQAKKFLEIVS